MTNSFDYTEEDLLNPRGSNSLSAQANYYQRQMYNEAVYPESSPRPLDTWYGKIYYGKVNQNQVVVMPRTAALAPLGSPINLSLRINPVVARLFQKFSAHMNHAMVVGALDPEGNPALFNLEPHIAYQSPQTQYNNYLEKLYGSFVQSLTDMDKNKIQDFTSYMGIFLPYLKDMARMAPVTKTGFMATPLATRFGSSLSIALAAGSPEDDHYKYRKFLNDPNFRFYSKAAKKFGFIVEKNMPWVLTADLFTDAFLAGVRGFYTPDYQLMTKDNFFSTFFVPTSFTDIQDLQLFIVNSYNLFVRENPYGEHITYDHCGNTKIKVFQRTQPSEGPDGAATTAQILTDKQLIELYLSLRYAEAREPFRLSADLLRQAEEAYQRYDGARLAAAGAVIDDAFRPYLYDETYFAYANLNSINFMLTGVDTDARSANITTTTTSTSSY